MRTIQKSLRCWCPGKELDLGSHGREWNNQAGINQSDGNGSGCIKRIVPTINAKTFNLIGVNEGVIQFGTTVKGFIDNQNVGLV